MKVLFNKKKGGSSAVISFDTSLRHFFDRICTLDWDQGAKPWFRTFTWLGNGQKPTGTKAHLDKSQVDNISLDKSPLLNLAGWTKAHFFGKNRFKSFIKLLTLISLLLSGLAAHAVCFHFLLYVVTNNLI